MEKAFHYQSCSTQARCNSGFYWRAKFKPFLYSGKPQKVSAPKMEFRNVSFTRRIDETKKNADIPVYFGKPIPYQTFDKSKTHQEWADWVKERVYKIPNEVGSKN